MDTSGSTTRRRVAVLVLACASQPYDRLIDAIRHTWGAKRVDGIDVFYVYGNPDVGRPTSNLARHLGNEPPRVEPDGIHHDGEVLIAGCADTIAEQEDCLLHKRLIAFRHLTELGQHDLIYTVCAASYIDLERLRHHVASLPEHAMISGPVAVDGTGTAPFVSGSSMMLTSDVARELAENADDIIENNQYGFRDDVTIGHWVAENLSPVGVDRVIEDIHDARPLTAEHVLRGARHTSADYVTRPLMDHRLVEGVHHYHFHSRRPDHMERFHWHHFGGGAKPSRARTAIEYVQIFGERCSGTNYLARLVEKNFADVELTSAFGGKHWFIKDLEPRGRSNDSTDHECVRPLTESDDTLFLVIHRDPLDWVRSMHTQPYHAPGHWMLPFGIFIRKPWVCYELEPANQLWAENDRGHYFIEQAGNVLQLRTQKIRHFARLQAVVPNVAYIRYEALLDGLDDLEEIADRFDIDLVNRPLLDESTYFGRGKGETFTGPKEYPPIADADLDFIRANLDERLEARLGYEL